MKGDSASYGTVSKHMQQGNIMCVFVSQAHTQFRARMLVPTLTHFYQL